MGSFPDIQVSKEHYFSKGYNHKARWLTYFYQIYFFNKYDVKSALEIGPGHGWMKRIAADLGVAVKTADIDPALQPDYVASVGDLSSISDRYDAVCAFEVLEHLPFETFVRNIEEMAKVSKRYIIISVPDHRYTLFHFKIKVPFFKYREVLIKIPSNRDHVFDGQHYWEIGKKGYGLGRIKEALDSTGLVVRENVVFPDTPLNHFFVLEKPQHF